MGLNNGNFPVIAIDAGNGFIKCIDISSGSEYLFPHHIHEITKTKYDSVVNNRIMKANGYIRVADVDGGTSYYVVGEAARKTGSVDIKKGSDRYTKSYYGVLVAFSLWNIREKGSDRIILYCTHAPRDVQWASFLIDSAFGIVEIEHLGITKEFNVREVNTFDEPFGGIFNLNHSWEDVERSKLKKILNDYEKKLKLFQNGRTHKRDISRVSIPSRKIIDKKNVLIIDVGTYTTDVVILSRRGRIDYNKLRTWEAGISNVLYDLEIEIKTRYSDEFFGTPSLSVELLIETLLTGYYKSGGHSLDCNEECHASIFPLINSISNILQEMGGVMQYDMIVLTGGGSLVVMPYLKKVYPKMSFKLAGLRKDDMRFSNIRGICKLYRLLQFGHDVSSLEQRYGFSDHASIG